MGTHKKTWIKSEKLEIIKVAISEEVLNASRQFEVSQPSIYKCMDQLDAGNESSLESLHVRRDIVSIHRHFRI